ncbi:MAG: hypothetical protein ABIK45_08585 [Pseudomonadota bacterium]
MPHAITKISFRIFFLTMALAAALAMPASVAAQDTAPLSTDDLVSLVGEAVVEDAAQADERVRKAREVYDEVMRRGTRQQQSDAAGELERARERSRDAGQKLDEARVEAIARESGRSPSEIRVMRESGMGWGAIANETGVHPSVNAKGKTQGKDKGKIQGKGEDKGKDKGKDKDKGKGKAPGKGGGGGADQPLTDADTGKGKAKGKGSQ